MVAITPKKDAPSLTAEQRLRKANEAISIKPMSGKLTILSRKIFNALLYHAQRQGELEIYRVPLSEITASVDYDSNDTKLLREHLRRMVETTVEWHDPKLRWGAGSLVSEAEIRFDGKNSYVEWSYGPKVRQFLLDPARYTPVSLQHQALFSTHAGLALFEICTRYATSPAGLTNRAPPEWWHTVLTGNPGQPADGHFYRYFKRDMIKPAMAEVNAMSNLQVTLVEHKKGRKVLELQFAISLASAGNLDLPPPPLIDGKVLARIVALGISSAEAEEIFGVQPETTIRDTLALVEARMKNKALSSLDSPAAFFKAALRRGYAAQKLSVAAPKGSALNEPAVTQDSVKAAAMEAARASYSAMPEAEQISLLAEYEAVAAGNPAVLRSLRRTGLKSKVVEVPFMGWLAERQAAPSASITAVPPASP